MDNLRKQISFREPFIAPRAKVQGRLTTILLYSLAGACGLAALAAVIKLIG
jgi:hypothetical protein